GLLVLPLLFPSPPPPPSPPPRVRTVVHHAEADPRDQGLPADGAPEGRAVGADQEDQGRRQVQGALLQVPLHALRLRRRQGQQAQAVPPTRFALVPAHLLPHLGLDQFDL
uniref:Uncharacterized protein n=1 Tax=Aegilops tauschii subsp. strangulata TaxID=200361 RepID=A0A453BCC4_AEGTS